MDTNVNFGIHLRAEGADQAEAGVDRVTASASELERQTVSLAQAQSSLVTATARVEAAQAAYGREVKAASEDQARLAAAASRVEAAQAQQAAAAARVQASQSNLTQQTRQLGAAQALTANQTQQLAFQLNDLFVQVASGGSPLTALIQQGSQLSGTFGGVGAAISATATFVAGFITPVTALGAAFAIATGGFILGRRELIEVQRALVLSGNAAGQTLDQFIGLGRAVAELSGGTTGRAVDVLTALATSSRAGAEDLQRFAAAAISLERVGGPAAEQTAKAFAELGKSPSEAALRLNESTRFLTASLLEQIRALEDQGRATEAAALAQNAYAATVESRVPQIASQLGLLERSWQGIADASRNAIDAIANIGRDTTSRQIDSLQQSIAIFERLGGNSGGGLLQIFARGRADRLRGELENLIEIERIQRRAASAGADRQQVEAALLEISNRRRSNMTAEQRLANELLAIENLRVKARLQEADVADLVKAARERAARSAGAPARGARQTDDTDEQIRLINRLSGLTATYTEDVKRLNAARASGLITEERFIELRAKLESQQPKAAEELRALELVARARSDARQQESAGIEDFLRRQQQANDASLDSARKRLQELKGETEAAELAAAKNVSLAEAIELVAIARLREERARLRDDSDRARQIDEEIETRARLIEQLGGARVRQANQRAADETAAAWQRITEDISQSLTDAIIEGGVSGREALERTFKALVLRPIIQAAVQPLAQSISGSLGSLLGLGGNLSGGAQTPGFGGGLGGLFSAGSALTQTGFGGTIGALQGAGAMIGQGQVLSGLAQGAGALGPYAAAAAAIFSIAKSLDNGGTPSVGSVVTADSTGARTGGSDPSGILRNLNQQTDQALRTLAGGAVGLLNGLAQSVGQAADFAAQAKFTADNVDSSFGDFVLSRGSRTVGDIAGNQPDGARTFDRDPTRGFEQFATDVAAITRQALAEIDLPAFARRQIDALGADATLDELTQVGQGIQAAITAIGALRNALEPLAGSLGLLADQSSDSLFRLAELSGGFDALGTNVQTFYGAFVSETDRAAAETERITGVLEKFGLTLPQTRGEFADLVQAQIALGEAGQPALAALLGVAGSFDQLTTRADGLQRSLSDALIGAAERFAPDQVLRLRTDRIRLDLSEAGVQIDLQQLLGASAADIEAFARAFISAGTASTEAQIAVLNAAGALAALRDTGTNATQVLQQRTQLEERLLQLQGNTAELQARELAAVTDAYNRSLLEQIFALENASRASQQFSSSLQGFFNTPDSLALRGNTRRLASDSSGQLFEFDLNDFAQQRSLLTEADIPGIIARYDDADRTRAEQLLAGNPFYAGLLLDQVARTRVAIPDTRADEARNALAQQMAANAASAPEDPLLKAQRENTEALKRLTGSLSDYLDSLVGSDVLGLSPEEQQRQLQDQFREAAQRALTGDAAAGERALELGRRTIEATRANLGNGAAGALANAEVVALLRQILEAQQSGVTVAQGSVQVTARGLSAVESAARGTTDAVAQQANAQRLADQRLVGFDA